MREGVHVVHPAVDPSRPCPLDGAPMQSSQTVCPVCAVKLRRFEVTELHDDGIFGQVPVPATPNMGGGI